jgi:glycogen synthase
MPASRAPLRIALVSREVYPFGGGGIGEYINACARLLRGVADVTVFTTSTHEREYRALRAARDSRLMPEDVEIVFVPEAREDEVGGYFSSLHLYSAAILDALRDHYGNRGPDLVEFSDYLGEGAVTVQARRAGDPLLRRSIVAVRLHTSAEICAVLDGFIDDGFPARITCELERLAIRDADSILWPGGDTLGTYRRYYGADRVAPGWRIRNPAITYPDSERAPDVTREAPLELLYMGRLERRKGVHNLVRAFSYIGSDDIRLRILGGDTDTAPLGTSMTSHVQMTAVGDGRIRLLEPVPREDLPNMISAHDAVVLPSLWEAWPYVGLEALRLDRPIIATPVGGFTEVVREGKSGWLAAATGTAALVVLLEQLLDETESVHRLRGSGRPVSVFEELTDSEEIVRDYRALIERGGRWGVSGAATRDRAAPRDRETTNERARVSEDTAPSKGVSRPLVSVIVPYYRIAAHVEDAVRSAIAQTHSRCEVILVNDGSLLEEDWIVAELATRFPITIVTQVNSGLGAARNFGISQARGEFVVPLDADNVLEPAFVERALAARDFDPRAAYVTAWSRYIDEDGAELPAPNIGYQPLGNSAAEIVRNNVAGDAAALISARVFELGFSYSEELTSYEDWDLYRQFHEAGYYGLVIPERLIRYRLRRDSMMRTVGKPHTARLAGEMAARSREREVEWTSSSA